MVSDGLRFRLDSDQRRRCAPVQATVSQETVIGCVLNRRILEAVAYLRRNAFDEQERGVYEAG
jgi:hypothetical protein